MSCVDLEKLIVLVKHRPSLYNPVHKDFRKRDVNETLWTAIAEELNQPVDDCREAWINLRYEYQIFVRKLRKWYYFKRTFRRPEMKYENDLMFLWKFIPNRSFESEKNLKNIRKSMEKIMSKDKLDLLISLVQAHKELFDTKHKLYGNAIRKGVIWSRIGEKMGEKSWKCIKAWILLKYQCCYNVFHKYSEANKKLFAFDFNFEFELELSFYNSYINYSSVISSKSFLLTRHDKRFFSVLPEGQIERDLIAVVKRYPQLYNSTDSTYSKLSNDEYMSIWNNIGKQLRYPASLCENTWIVLLNLHKELFSITVSGHKFKDVWKLSKNFGILLKSGRDFKPNPSVNVKRQEFLRALIKTVEKYPSLYRSNFRTAKLAKTWERIGAQLNTSGPQCKRDWDGLKVSYQLYREKISEKFSDKFLYAEDMSFLEDSSKRNNFPVLSSNADENLLEVTTSPKDSVIEMSENGIYDSFNLVEDKEALLKIIAEIEKEPILYDYMRSDYNDKKLQREAYDRILLSSGFENKYLAESIEKVWLKLRLGYWRYLDGDYIYDFMKKVPEIPKALEFLREFRVTTFGINYQKLSSIQSASSSSINFNINIASAEEDFIEKCDKTTDSIVEYCNNFISVDKSSNLKSFKNINILRFMAEVKKHEIIYNYSHPSYNNKLERLNTWAKIGAELNYTIFECNQIWCHIVKRFMKYKEYDFSYPYKLNSIFWRDMIYMYTQKKGIYSNDHSTDVAVYQFKPELHCSDNIEDVYRNLGIAVNNSSKNNQRHLLREIDKMATKFLRKYNCI